MVLSRVSVSVLLLLIGVVAAQNPYRQQNGLYQQNQPYYSNSYQQQQPQQQYLPQNPQYFIQNNRPQGLSGAMTQTRPADQLAQQAANSLISQVESQLNVKLTSYQVTQYATQVVSGTNWAFKIMANGGFINVRAYQAIGSEQLQLSRVEVVSADTPLQG